jgi:hypothetical protein
VSKARSEPEPPARIESLRIALLVLLIEKPKRFRIYLVKQSEIKQFTSWLGKRSYKARLNRLGLERLQEIARENGKKGGRPKGSGKKQKTAKKGGK